MAKSCCGPRAIANAYTALLLDNNSKLAKERLEICNGCEFKRRGFCQACPTTVKCWVKAKVRGIDQVCPKAKW